MKKVLVVLMMMFSIFGLVACTKTPSAYEITIQNQSDWQGAAIVEFYDMSGALTTEVGIKNNKATIDLQEGSYIVQIKDAPESVDYNIVVLTSSSKSQTITLTNAGKSGIYPDKFEFSCGAIVLDNGVPQEGRQVLMCTPEGEDGAPGVCLDPKQTDKNGLAQIKASALEYEVKILNDELDSYVEKPFLMKERHKISAAKRFYIMDLAKKI